MHFQFLSRVSTYRIQLKSVYITVFLCVCILVSAQAQQARIDSIQERLSLTSQDDFEQVDLLIALAQAYQTVKFDSCISYSTKAVLMASKLNYEKGIADANKQMAIVNYLNANVQEADACNQIALRIYSKLGDYKGIGAILNNIGVICQNRGDYHKALNYLKLSERYRKRAGDLVSLGGTFNNIGNVYMDMGQYAESLHYLFRSLMIRELNHDQLGIAHVLSNIACSYEAMNNLLEAKKYADRSYKIFKANAVPDGLFQVITVLGGIHLKQKHINLAKIYFDEAYQLALEIGIEENTEVALTNLGKVSIELQDYSHAEHYLKEALKMASKVGDRMGEAICMNGIGEIALKEKNPKEALVYLIPGIRLSKEIGHKEEIKNGTLVLSKVYELLRQNDLAMKYLKEYIAYRDSLSNDVVKRLVQETGYKYELQKKENRILQLSSERNKYVHEQELQRNNVLGLIGLLVLTLIIIFLLYSSSNKERRALEAIQAHQKKIEKQAADLEELNSVKDKVFSVLAHDLRSPVAALLALIDLLEQKEITPEEFVKIQQSMGSGIRSLSLLLDNLLNWSRSQIAGNLHASPKDISVKSMLEKVKLVYQQVSAQKEIHIEVDADAALKVHADPDHLDIILRNLLSNAIKYSNKGMTVFMRCKHDINQIIFEVEDQGMGISPDKVALLSSTMPQQSLPGTMGEKGTGIGLMLCSEFAKLNGARMEVSSKAGRGSVFRIIF